MKKSICFILFAACISFNSFSQTEKGNFLIGGSVGFTHTSYQDTNNDDVSSTSINIAPSVSYFLVDRLSIGLITPLSFGASSGPDIKSSSTSYSIGPTVRYYFLLDEKWAIFPQFNYSYGWVSATYTFASAESTSSFTRYAYSGGVGLTYFISNNVGLEGILRYEKQSESTLTNDRSAINFNIGLQVYINRKNK